MLNPVEVHKRLLAGAADFHRAVSAELQTPHQDRASAEPRLPSARDRLGASELHSFGGSQTPHAQPRRGTDFYPEPSYFDGSPTCREANSGGDAQETVMRSSHVWLNSGDEDIM